jgi:hypothetical protein
MLQSTMRSLRTTTLQSSLSHACGGARLPLTRPRCRTAPLCGTAAASVRAPAAAATAAATAATATATEAWYVRYPLTLAIGVATVKTAAADILVQKQAEQREHLDVRRLALFTAFGACYFGAFQYFLYVRCFSWWFDAARLSKMSLRAIMAEGGATRANWFKQMGFDLFLHGHLFFPRTPPTATLNRHVPRGPALSRSWLESCGAVYYTFKLSITGTPSLMEGRPLPEIATAAFAKYRENARDDWIAFWQVWVPGDIIVFGLVPMWARLPVNNAISFLYVLVLSFMRGAPDEES